MKSVFAIDGFAEINHLAQFGEELARGVVTGKRPFGFPTFDGLGAHIEKPGHAFAGQIELTADEFDFDSLGLLNEGASHKQSIDMCRRRWSDWRLGPGRRRR